MKNNALFLQQDKNKSSRKQKKADLDFKKYFEDFITTLRECVIDKNNEQGLLEAADSLRQAKLKKKKIILVGNGGSAAIAEHMAADFTKNAGLKAVSISGVPLLTMYANDYGFEYIYSKAIESYLQKGDILIAISSGGESRNIINAVQSAKNLGCRVITFSAFEKDNTLRKLGDINIYLSCRAYGYIEIIHNLLIHFLNDKIIGSTVYKIL